MATTIIDWPVRFVRQYAESLDRDFSFSTTLERTNYLSNPLAYQGQIVYDEEEDKLYRINSTKDGFILLDGGTSTGEANTASNLGTGVGVFSAKVSADLQFKSLLAEGATTITDNGDGTVTISSTDTNTGEVNTGANMGTGYQIFAGKTGVELTFRTLKAGTNTTITEDADGALIITGGAGETNTASSKGTGTSLVFGKTGADLEFKSIKAGTNTAIEENADGTLTLNVTIPEQGVKLKRITVAGNTFVVGDPINNALGLATSVDFETSEFIGFVMQKEGDDLLLAGPGEWIDVSGWGLAGPGEYFLTSTGGITTTEPTDTEVRKPVLITLNATEGQVLHTLGTKQGSTSGETTNTVKNDTDTYTSTPAANQIVTLTQAEYDAIATKDPNTIYAIPKA
jgi:hypothetical protein